MAHKCNHSHNHEHSHGEHGHIHPITKNLTVAFLLNISFTIIEFIGGFLTNSVAILSDAVHDLGDSVAIGSALYFEKRSEKKRDQKFSYGYRRFSTLAALINTVVLTTGSVVIIIEAVPRFLNPEQVHSSGMMLLALLGILMNGLAFFRLRGNDSSVNNRTVMLHLLEDALGWVAVLIGSIIIYYTQWYIIDPILSFGIAAYILVNAVKNFNQVWQIFMQAVPKKVDYQHVEKMLVQLTSVKEVHDIHIWSLDGEFNIASLHLVMAQNLNNYNAEEVKAEARSILKQEGIQHVTIELEGPEEHCDLHDNCVD